MRHILYIALGGSLGAVTRYLVSKGIHGVYGSIFPMGTLFVNATGSFLIGFLFFFFENVFLSNDLKSFMLIGFLGAYTTFSTYSLETINFVRAGEFRTGLINIFLSNVLCLLFVVCGMVISRAVFKYIR